VRNRGLEPLVSTVLLVLAAVIIFIILLAFFIPWINNVVNNFKEVVQGIGYLEIEKIEYSNNKLAIYVSPIGAPVKVSKVVVLTYPDYDEKCDANINVLISSSFEKITFSCSLSSGTYVVKVYTSSGLSFEKVFTIQINNNNNGS